jgi:hypothetical protein
VPDLEYSYYAITNVENSHDCDYGTCRLYDFKHNGQSFQLGIYEDFKLLSILERETEDAM